MRLYIVRHGEAEARAETDAQRPLTPRGRRQVDALWGELYRDGVRVERLVCSPYLRALQTAELIAGHYDGISPGILQLITPDDRPHAVIDWLAQQERLDGLVLVSHMPLVAALSGMLTGDDRLPFGVGSVACIDLDVVARDGGRLIWQRHAT